MPTSRLPNPQGTGGTSAGGTSRLPSPTVANPLYKPTPTTSNPTLPYLAKEFIVTKDKTGKTLYEPFYGGGLSGWARKATANIFDPRFLTGNMSDEQKTNYQMYIPKLENLINKTTLWDSWAGPILGLSAKNLAEIGAAFSKETDVGDKAAQVTGVGARWAGQSVLGVGGILQTLEYGIRQYTAASRSLHEFADTSNMKSSGEKSVFDNKFWNGTILEGFQNYMVANTHPGGLRDIQRILQGNPDWEQADDIFKKNFRSASMLYTMMNEPVVAAEFERRYKAGEDPYKLAYELQNPWTEIIYGSILDPLSWTGLSLPGKFGKAATGVKLAEHIPFGSKLAEKIPLLNKTLFNVPWEVVYRTPDFGDIVGLGKLVGRGKLEERARIATSMMPEFAEFMGEVKRLKETGASDEAVHAFLISSMDRIDAATKVGSEFGVIKNTYSPLALRSKDKWYTTATQVQNLDARLLSATGGNYDKSIEIYSNLITLLKGTGDEKVRAVMMLSEIKGMGDALFSPIAMKAAFLVDKLYDGGKIADLITSKATNKQELLLAHLTKAFEEISPSVEDMYNARKLVRGDEFKAKLLTAGENIPEEMLKKINLAKMYDDVPAYAKAAQGIATKVGVAYNPMMKFQGVLFFNLSPAYPIRNGFGNFSAMAIDLGAESAANTMVEALGAAYSGDKAVMSLVGSLVDDVVGALGYEPSKMRTAFSRVAASQFGNKSTLFAKTSSNVELIYSAEIVKNVVLREIRNTLRGGVFPALKPELDALTSSMGQDATNLLLKTIDDNYGNLDKALKEFNDVTKSGNIEMWRYEDPSPAVKELLVKYGAEKKFKEMMSAETPQDMVRIKQELLGFFDEKSKLAGLEKPVATLPEDFAGAPVEIADGFQGDLFKGQLNAWDQVAFFYKDFTSHFYAKLGELVGAGRITPMEQSEYIRNVNRISDAFPTLTTNVRRVNTFVREFLVTESRKKGADLKKLWKSQVAMQVPVFDEATKMAKVKDVVKDGRTVKEMVMEEKLISLAEIYPNQNLALLTPDLISQKSWNMYFPIRSQEYTVGRAGLYDAQLAEMRNNPFGINVDELAASMGMGDNRVNPLSEIQKYREQAFEYAHLSEIERLIGDSEDSGSALIRYALELGYSSPVNSMGSEVAKGYQRANLPISENDLLGLVNKYAPKKAVKMPPKVQKEFDDITHQIETMGRTVSPEMASKREELLARINKISGDPNAMEEVISLRQQIRELSTSPELKALQERRAAIDNKYMPAGYEKLGDVTFDEGQRALDAWAAENGRRVYPFNVRGEQTPSAVRQLHESKAYYSMDINTIVNKSIKNWGNYSSVEKVPDRLLNDFSRVYKEKWEPNKLYIGELANETRDFILHSYEKTYLDLALSYVLPYQYWQTRTYGKFMQRAVQDPRILVGYTRYKNTLAKLHAGMPDWWKQNIPITGLPGINPDEPLFFNLEATINPINGLTGTDFNDPYKRVNWWTQVIDDMTKFGPSMAMPLNWAVAMALWNQGEKDASARWAGRMFPQSQQIKSALTLAGVKGPEQGYGKYNEYDPITSFMSGGLDPYEQKKVHRGLAAMVADGSITEEQSYDAAYYKNEVWDEAVSRTLKGRAPASMVSFFLGIGFKSRTENDMVVDMFYEEYSRVVQTKQATSPEAYKNAMSALREKYPFMDTLLISKNYGEERETSYAYGILARIPPGQSDDLLKMVGINQDTVDKFYAAKGDMTQMTKPERELFMAAVMNMGALLKIPDNATSVDWNRAKTAYSQVYTDAEKMYGSDIWTKVDTYYGYLDQNYQLANDYLDAHPEVQEVFQYKQQAIAANPDVYKYYGSIDTIQRYYDTLLRQELVAQFGEEIYAQFDEYGEIGLTDPKAAARYYKAHPALKQYGKAKRKMQDEINKTTVKMAGDLPERPNVLLREDIQQPIEVQNQMAEQLNPPKKTWADWKTELSAPMQRLIVSYFKEGEPLEYAAQEQLDYMAGNMGMSGDDLLQQMGVALFEESQPGGVSRLP